MSSSRPPPAAPAITLDISMRPGETHEQHLDRIARMWQPPGKARTPELPSPPSPTTDKKLEEDEIARMREVAYAKLRPPAEKKKGKRSRDAR